MEYINFLLLLSLVNLSSWLLVSNNFGKSVTCEKGVEASWNNETWGLDLINSNQQKRINCSIEFKTISEFSEAKLGDYVSYTPSKTNYEITNDLTGCTGEGNVCDGLKKQSINPSELNLWRVIRKNSDGSIDLVSEYTSSNEVYFYGKEGYKNHFQLRKNDLQSNNGSIHLAHLLLEFRGDKVSITDAIREQVTSKLSKLDKYFDSPETINVVVNIKVNI